MPRSWVKDHFKHILVESAEDWMKGKSKGATSTRSDIIKGDDSQEWTRSARTWEGMTKR
jgi:hypothetical protein